MKKIFLVVLSLFVSGNLYAAVAEYYCTKRTVERRGIIPWYSEDYPFSCPANYIPIYPSVATPCTSTSMTSNVNICGNFVSMFVSYDDDTGTYQYTQPCSEYE